MTTTPPHPVLPAPGAPSGPGSPPAAGCPPVPAPRDGSRIRGVSPDFALPTGGSAGDERARRLAEDPGRTSAAAAAPAPQRGRDGASHGRAAWDARAARFSGWWAQALELVLPVSCAVCGEPGRALCRACRIVLRRATAQPGPLLPPPPLAAARVRVWTAGEYEHELASCLLAFKNGGRTDLAPVLSAVLSPVLAAAARELRSAGAAESALLHWVPVPTSARARRRRWFDPVASILGGAALPRNTRVTPAVSHRRVRGRGTGSQKARGGAQRERALRGTMRAREVRGAVCVVVDDVLTTGATAAEAVRALRAAGARVPAVVTLAGVRVPRSPRENA